MSRRIEFINPFGTSAYDSIIAETLMAYVGEGTELVISSLDNCPPNIDYYYNKHLMETAVFEKVMQSEAAGFDAVVVGCCYDPGVRVARELVDIPVIGPLEASMQMAGYFGHSYTVVTDHHKAVPYLEDMVRTYGIGANCRGVRCVNWWVKDMIKNPEQVALDTIAVSRQVLSETRAETIIMGCTIVAACHQRYLMTQKAKPEVTIVNPNLLALKMAESLADLKKAGVYQMARVGYYEQPRGLYRKEFEEQRQQQARALHFAKSAG
jgi:allantoin racemase